MRVTKTLKIFISLYNVSRNSCKKHQDAVFGVDIAIAIQEGLTFCQTRSNAIILQGTLPAHCILKVERLETGEKLCERQYLSSRPHQRSH